MKVHGSVSLQLLTCLIVYVTQVHSIMVKFGTREGPITAPEPTRTPPTPRRLEFFVPAPVWEERKDDIPDPNEKWRPPLFQPYQPRSTQVIIPDLTPQENPPFIKKPQTYAQKVVNSYRSPKILEPYVLTSQNIPGVGLSYFRPAYLEASDEVKRAREEETNENDIEELQSVASRRNEVFHWHPEKTIVKPPMPSINYVQPAYKPYKFVPPPYVESKNFRTYTDY